MYVQSVQSGFYIASYVLCCFSSNKLDDLEVELESYNY